METEKIPVKKVHHGYNIRRVRISKGIKQAYLAEQIGHTQQSVSQIEQRRELEEHLLVQIAEVLKVPVELLKEMEEEGGISFYVENNTFEASDQAVMKNQLAQDIINNEYKTAFEEIKKLYEEKEALYEARLQDKQAEIDFLRKLLEDKNK